MADNDVLSCGRDGTVQTVVWFLAAVCGNDKKQWLSVDVTEVGR